MWEAVVAKWLAGRLLNCAWDRVKAAARQPEFFEAFERACQKAARENPALFSDYTAPSLDISETEHGAENLATRLQESFGTANFPTPDQLTGLLLDSWRLRKETLKPEEAAPLFREAEGAARPFLQRLADLFFRELAQVDSVRNPFVVSALQQIIARLPDDSPELVAVQAEKCLAEAKEKLRRARDEFNRNNFEAAARLSEDAAGLAKTAGDVPTQRKAVLQITRALGEHVMSSQLPQPLHEETIARIHGRIDDLEKLAEERSTVALERALVARLEGKAEEALTMAETAANLAGDDIFTQADALIARLQALWQLGRVDGALALSEEVERLRSQADDDPKLVLDATWLRTLCKAGKAATTDVEQFATNIRSLLEKRALSRDRLALVINQVALEFARAERVEDRCFLCELGYEVIEPVRDRRKLTLISLEAAELSAVLGNDGRARAHLGRADSWAARKDLARQTEDESETTFEAMRLFARGRTLARLADRSDSPHELYQEAYDALKRARDFATQNRAELKGDLELYLADLCWWLGRTAINLGRVDEGAETLKAVRSDAALANPHFAREVGAKAWGLEAEALALGGHLSEAADSIEALLKDPRLPDETKQRPLAFQRFLERSVCPVVDWFKSPEAGTIQRIVAEHGLKAGVGDQFTALISWWKEWRVGSGGSHPGSELLDFWGRGGFSRIAAAVRAKPHAAIAVDARSLDDIRSWVRIFCPLFDTVIVKWKDELGAGLVMTPIHEAYGDGPADFGGHGYSVASGSVFSDREQWCPALSWANPLSQEVTEFLGGEALALVKAGRLVVLPAPLVGCTQTAVGWTDTLLVESFLGGVVNVARTEQTGTAIIGHRRVLDISKIQIPFIDNVALTDLAKVLDETEAWVGPLRSLLWKTLSAKDLGYERWERVAALEYDIQEACRELRERLKSLTARHEEWAITDASGGISASERGTTPLAHEPITALLRSVATASRDLAPWIPYLRLQDHGGYLNWTCPLDNPSKPPDGASAAQLPPDSRVPEVHTWLYPGTAGWVIPTAFSRLPLDT